MDPLQILMVHQLLARYGHVVDAGEWDRFGELFVDDAVLDYRGVNVPDVLHGVGEITDFFRTANHPSAHHVLNVVVDEQDGEIRVQSKFVVPYSRATHLPNRWYGGDYQDVVVQTGGAWRFRSRRCTARWQLTTADGPIEEARLSF